MRADLINDLREVADNIYRGEIDGWDEDMVREAIRALEEAQSSSAPETVKPFGTGALCEEDPDPEREGYCAYHGSFH